MLEEPAALRARSKLLRELMVANTGQSFVIGFRADGSATDANIIIKSQGKTEFLRVGINGGKIRADSWYVVGEIEKTLMGTFSHFADDIQALFEKAINEDKRGYVWLTVKKGKVRGGKLTAHF